MSKDIAHDARVEKLAQIIADGLAHPAYDRPAEIFDMDRVAAAAVLAAGYVLPEPPRPQDIPDDEWEYAEATQSGWILGLRDSMAYMGPVVKMRRRKAGAWEPVITDEATR